MFSPDEPWLNAFRFSPPDILFLEGGEEHSENEWKTLRTLASTSGNEASVFLLFGPPEKPDKTREPEPSKVFPLCVPVETWPEAWASQAQR